MRRLIVLLVVGGTATSLSAQDTHAYRILQGNAISYKGETLQGNGRFSPGEISGTVVSLAPQRAFLEIGQDTLPGAVSVTATGQPATEYVGPIGLKFELGAGENNIIVEYPRSDVTLSLVLAVENVDRLLVRTASYNGGCKNPISSLADQYLQNWVSAIPKPLLINKGKYLELKIPDPLQKAPPGTGQKEFFRSSCASGFGSDRRYSLTIDATPAGASVYINGKYYRGRTFSVRDNPAWVLVRYPGCQDFAKSMSLIDGENLVKITLGGCRP